MKGIKACRPCYRRRFTRYGTVRSYFGEFGPERFITRDNPGPVIQVLSTGLSGRPHPRPELRSAAERHNRIGRSAHVDTHKRASVAAVIVIRINFQGVARSEIGTETGRRR